MKTKIFFLTGFLFAALGCTKWDYDRIDFAGIEVITGDVEVSQTSGTATVEGLIDFSNLNEDFQYSVTYGHELSVDEFFTNPIPRVAGTGFTTGDIKYETNILDLESGINYYVRAYALIQETLVVGRGIPMIVTWINESENNPVPVNRSDAVTFNLTGKGYMVTGFDEDGNADSFFEYDGSSNSWTEFTDTPFGGERRNEAIGFAVNDVGFVGLGKASNGTLLNDFWKFDANSLNPVWEETFSFPGQLRLDYVTVIVSGQAYLMTGKSFFTFHNDVWLFDENTGFEEKNPFPGVARSEAATFTIGNLGYIGLGRSDSGLLSDFWSFDGANFVPVESFEGGARRDAIAFTLNGKGYVGMGISASGLEKDIWEYDPLEGWSKVRDFPGEPRLNPVVMVTDNRAYIGLGHHNDQFFNDWWEYSPEL